METLGIIDIGSNSAKLLVVQRLGGKSFRIVEEMKESVRLGKDIQDDGSLNPDRIEVAIKTLKQFKKICLLHEVDEMIVVATAAVRFAKDQDAFLKRVKQEVGLEIKVLSGEEEAFYDYFGIVNSIDIKTGLMIDIGGASTEVVYIKDRKLIHAVSLPFGAITLTEQFNLYEEITPSQLMQLRAYLMQQYTALEWLLDIKHVDLIGVGGTARNIGKISRKSKEYFLKRTHNYEITSQEVMEIIDKVSSTPLKQRRKIKGLSKARVDIFPAACEAIRVLIECCKIGKFIVSGHGVREGLLYEYLQGGSVLVEDVLDFSLHHMMKQYDINQTITSKVWQEAYKICHADPGPLLQTEALKILKISCMLYRIGIQIRYYSFTQHSFYMILHAYINGLTHRELLMVAYTILYYKDKELTCETDRYRELLSEKDFLITRKLGEVLNQAIYQALSE